jgi:hypothetical protein
MLVEATGIEAQSILDERTESGIAKLQNQNDQRECKRHEVGEEDGPVIQKQSVYSPERGAESKHALRDERDAVGSFLANNFHRLRQPAKRRARRCHTSNNLEPGGHGLTPIPLRLKVATLRSWSSVGAYRYYRKDDCIGQSSAA